MDARSVTVAAPAKINLHLGVGARRPDGYHDVTTVVTTLQLADRVTCAAAETLHLECMPEVTERSEDNLAYRAALEMGLAYGREPGVRITIDKQIPHGAGLGGGSSDAAAVIRVLSALWGLSADDPRPSAIATSLGADVPFFLSGGTHLLGGRGDEPLRELPTPRLAIALVKPPSPVPTAAAYAAFDAEPVAPADPEALLAAIASGRASAIAALASNNLERAAARVVPEVADALAWVRDREGVLGAHVAGSGSAVYAICEDSEGARRVAEDAAARGLWGVATMTRPDPDESTDMTGEAHS